MMAERWRRLLAAAGGVSSQAVAMRRLLLHNFTIIVCHRQFVPLKYA